MIISVASFHLHPLRTELPRYLSSLYNISISSSHWYPRFVSIFQASSPCAVRTALSLSERPSLSTAATSRPVPSKSFFRVPCEPVSLFRNSQPFSIQFISPVSSKHFYRVPYAPVLSPEAAKSFWRIVLLVECRPNYTTIGRSH